LLAALGAASTSVFVTGGCNLLDPDPPRNLLVIAVDGLRLDALRPTLGAPRTPNIQRLGGAGVEFALCFTPSSATQPAAAALLSARTPSSSRVRVDGQDVDADVVLLQEHLREAGWQTYGALASPQVLGSADGLGLDRGFHLVRTHRGAPASAQTVTQEIVPMLARANSEVPWFAFVQYADPTAPYSSHGTADRSARFLVDGKPVDRVGTSDPGLWRRTLRVAPGRHALSFDADEGFVVASLRVTRGGDELPFEVTAGGLGVAGRAFAGAFEAEGPVEAEIEVEALVHDVPDLKEARQRYKLEVEAVDRAIGDLVGALERNGTYDRTCIVLVATHGESLGERGETGHGAGLSDHVLRVPLLVKPALNAAERSLLAQRRLDIVRSIDVAPTLLEMHDVDPLPRSEGLSLLHAGERQILAEVHPPQAASTVLALRDERYKLVYEAGEGRFSMYDVKSDTLEMDDVYALQGHFRPKWQARLRDLADRAPQPADGQIGAAR
jgi:membrane-anchored protein YejM (alkaline phosphatase superfamily)